MKLTQVSRNDDYWSIVTYYSENVSFEVKHHGERLLFKCAFCDEIHELTKDIVPVETVLDIGYELILIKDVGQAAMPVRVEWSE